MNVKIPLKIIIRPNTILTLRVVMVVIKTKNTSVWVHQLALILPIDFKQIIIQFYNFISLNALLNSKIKKII